MSQYSGMFISCLVVSLLINFGCNSKSSKNLSDSDFKKKIFREYRPKGNIKIKFNHNNIPSATCSKYNIIAEGYLQNDFVNTNLKLIDPEKHFFIDRTNQEVCASTGKLTLLNSRAAPIGSRAQIVFEDEKNTAIDEIEVATTIPINIIYINILFLSQDSLSQDKNLGKLNFLYVAPGDNSGIFKIYVIRKLNANREYLNSADEISLVATNQEGKDFTLPIINIVADTATDFFYFKIPSTFSYGPYAMRLFVNNTPNVEQLFTINVVDKYKEIDILFDNSIVDEVSIPTGTCKNYTLIVKDFNNKKDSIHSISNNTPSTKFVGNIDNQK